MIERQTAIKVRIWDIVNGTWIPKEGFEPSFVKTPSGEEISRARVLATVVNRFESEDGNFASITLDDGSDTIRAKQFKEIALIKKSDIGDLVDVVGKVREYNGEIYMVPEMIKKVTDPNMESLRKLEIVKKLSSRKEGEKKPKPASGSMKTFFKKGDQEEKSGTLRTDMLKIIGSKEEGISYSELVESLKKKAKESEIEEVINELLSEGICYEPTPGKIKKI